jgi:hypothetical protein
MSTELNINFIYMQLLHLQYSIGQKPSDLLRWFYDVELRGKGIGVTPSHFSSRQRGKI